MSTMEQMKARTKLTLASASEADRSRPTDTDRQWTRFVFNSDAPLEEDGARPSLDFESDGEDGGNQGKQAGAALTAQEAASMKQREVSHADAIFGAQAPSPQPQGGSSCQGEGAAPSLEAGAADVIAPCLVKASRGKLSWRERLALSRQQ